MLNPARTGADPPDPAPPQDLPRSFVVLELDEGAGGATLAVLHGLRQRGLRVAAMTPVVRDARWQGGQWVSPHVTRLQAEGGFAFPSGAVCPYLLDGAVGADRQPAVIRRDVVVDAYRALATWADMVVVEARGGLDTELGPGLSLHGLLARLRLPVVAVAATGPEGPARLQAAAAQCRAQGRRLAGWLLTGDASPTPAWQAVDPPWDTSSCLGLIPAQALHAPAQAADHIAWPRLLQAVTRGAPAVLPAERRPHRPPSA